MAPRVVTNASSMAPADPSLTALVASIRRNCRPGLWSQGVTLARAGGVAVESRTRRGARAARALARARRRADGRALPDGDRVGVRLSVAREPVRARRGRGDRADAAADRGDRGAVKRPAGEGGAAEPTRGAAAATAATDAGAAAGERLRARGVSFHARARRVEARRACWSAPTAPRRRSKERSARWSPIRRARRACRSKSATLQADRLLGTGSSRAALSPGKLDGLMQILAGAPRAHARRAPDRHVRGGAACRRRRSPTRWARAAPPRSGSPSAPTRACAPWSARAWRWARRTGAPRSIGWARPRSRVARGCAIFPGARHSPASALGELVTKRLPDLARRTILDVRSRRLPPVVRDLAPRVVLRLDQIAGGLSVLPALVYGSPPVARIDGDRLIHLGGPVPIRDAPSEQRALERLRSELGLLPGRRTNYTGVDAPRFVDKLKRWRGDLSGDAAGIVKPQVTLQPRLSVVAGVGGDADAVRFELTFAASGAGGSNAAKTERVGRRRRGGARLAGRAGDRPAVRRWLGVAADRLAAEARPARRRSAGRARARRPPRAPRAAGAGGAVRGAGASAAARARSPGAAGRRVRAPARGAAAAGPHGDAAAVSAAGAELARVPAQRRSRRHPRRRHGARQDAAGDVRVHDRRRGPHAGGLPDQRDLQLGRRAGALPSRPARLRLSRRLARARRHGRRDADQLRAAAPRRRGLCRR